jgi:membrane protease YdiL (CAAX protease family)
VRDLALSTAALAVAITLLVRLLLDPAERFADLGLDRDALRRGWKPGLLVAVGLFVLFTFVLTPALGTLGLRRREDVLNAWFSDPRDAGWWLIAAVVGGGYREELMRAFVLTRCERVAGAAGLVVALLVYSAVFGLSHSYQGPRGIVSASLTGFVFGLIYVRRRNLAEVMVAHAAFDILGVTAGYLLHARSG